MKLDKLYKKINKNHSHSTIKYQFYKTRKKDPIIIGITGSRGKSTVAYLLHNYLKNSGYKSILYSSLGFDSPGTINVCNEPYETVLANDQVIKNLIEEAKNYNPDFIVLEVHEYALENDNVCSIPFDIRVLTNLNPLHNEEMYSEEEYVNLKLKFFQNIDSECKCIFGFQDFDKTMLERLLNINSCKKEIYSSKYVAEIKGVDTCNVSGLLTELESSIDGLDFQIEVSNKVYNLKTNLIMPYNALNILGVITILNCLNIFNINKFKDFIRNVEIPGRCFKIKVKNRYIIIDYFLNPMLENLKIYQKQGKINDIRVVTGSIGTGFDTWNEKFKTERFINSRRNSRKFAMDILNKNADFIYLTENDNANENINNICQELVEYLDCSKIVTIFPLREEAIRNAIINSKENDVIFISGRGDRRILCCNNNKIRKVKDSDIIRKVLGELEWYYHGFK